MTGAVKLGDRSITFCGNAATPIRYKQVFHKDLLMSFKSMSAEDFDVDMITQLAYIMAMQAEGADFKTISFDDFIDWVSQFEQNDVLEASPDIINLWMSGSKTNVKAKKK